MSISNPAPHVMKISFVTAAAGTTTWSDPIRIPAGFSVFNLKWEITGGGSVTWVYSLSESHAGDYVIPSGTSTTKIAVSGTSTSGSNADGLDCASFQPEVAPYLKIGAVEYRGTATALDAWLVIG